MRKLTSFCFAAALLAAAHTDIVAIVRTLPAAGNQIH